MLIILEGPDGAGKSTLANQLKDVLRAEVIAHGPYLGEANIFHRYLDPMGKMYGNRSRSYIFDRSWLSEQVYGPLMRNVDRIGVLRRILDRVAMGLPAACVLCLPPWKNVKETYVKRAMSEYPPRLSVLEKIWQGYRKLDTDVPLLLHDYTSDNLNDLLNDISVIEQRYTGVGGIGCWRPRRVSLLVGEKQSLSGQPPQWAFVSELGSSPWLAERLAELNISEGELYWANALDQLGTPRSFGWVKELEPQRVIALGKNADMVLGAQGIAHITIEHPQYWKRFHFDEPWANLRKAFVLRGDHDLTHTVTQ